MVSILSTTKKEREGEKDTEAEGAGGGERVWRQRRRKRCPCILAIGFLFLQEVPSLRVTMATQFLPSYFLFQSNFIWEHIKYFKWTLYIDSPRDGKETIGKLLFSLLLVVLENCESVIVPAWQFLALRNHSWVFSAFTEFFLTGFPIPVEGTTPQGVKNQETSLTIAFPYQAQHILFTKVSKYISTQPLHSYLMMTCKSTSLELLTW